MPPAADAFDVVLRESPDERVTLRRAALGALARSEPRFVIEVVDRETGTLVLAIPADGTRSEAIGVAHVVQNDANTLEKREFVRRYHRWYRRRWPRGRGLVG